MLWFINNQMFDQLNFHNYSTYILQPLEGLQKEKVEKLVMEFINNSIRPTRQSNLNIFVNNFTFHILFSFI